MTDFAIFLIMVVGFVVLLSMVWEQLRTAHPADFLLRGGIVAAAWFTLCLVVLG